MRLLLTFLFRSTTLHFRPRSSSPLTAVFLALLLLLTQQMGFAHAISHVGDRDANSSRSKQLPAKLACDHCQAFAQLASPLASAVDPCVFMPPAPEQGQSMVAQARVARTVCVFESRAPPACL